MAYVAAGLVVAVLALLVVGAVTGRVRTRSCCAPADPSRDLRMRGAFEDEAASHERGPGPDDRPRVPR